MSVTRDSALVAGVGLLAVLVLNGYCPEPPGPAEELHAAPHGRGEQARGTTLAEAVAIAIARIDAGEVPTSEEDARIFAGVDYASLVACGAYTVEEAELQSRIDRTLVARSKDRNPDARRREQDER